VSLSLLTRISILLIDIIPIQVLISNSHFALLVFIHQRITMQLKPLIYLFTILLFAVPAMCGELKPALYADPTYSTKSIKEITVFGLDARENTALKIDLPMDNVNAGLDKKGYKVKGFKTGFAAGLANLKSSVKRAAHGKDTTMSAEDSVRAAMTFADLTTNHEVWLNNMSANVGDWIFVLVLNSAESELKGNDYDCHAILTGYLFDRVLHSIIWSDRVEDSDQIPNSFRSGQSGLYSYTSITAGEAAQIHLSNMVSKKMFDSMAKRGKFFRLSTEHPK